MALATHARRELDDRLAAFEGVGRRHAGRRPVRAATARRIVRRAGRDGDARERARPDGHPRLGAHRAVPGRPVRGAAAPPAARVRARAGVRRGRSASRPAARKVWFELRDARRRAAVLDVARRTGTRSASARWPTARRSSPPAAATTTPARAPPRRSSPSRSPTCAWPARATCSPSSERLRRALHAEGLFEPQKRLPAPARCRARSASSPASAARRATTCWPACAAAAGRGRVVWAFAPVQDRHAAPRDHARAAGPRRLRGGRGDRRRPRRRLAGRPVRVLRRDAVPHRRAAARAGDRLGRPPHRPHADRRRRRRRLLDADPRGRGRRPAATAASRPRARSHAHARAAGAPRPPRDRRARPRRSPALSRAPGAPRRPPPRLAAPAAPRDAREPPRRAASAAARARRNARGARRSWPRNGARRRASAACRRRPARAPARSRSPPTTRSGRWSAATRSSRARTASRSRAPPRRQPRPS